jgi:hypothetical protein
MTRRSSLAFALVLLTGTGAFAQAPDGNAVLRGAGVQVPRRGGAEAAFDAGLRGPAPVPPGAIGTLIVGMGPVGNTARVRNAYAFGVLAGRSGRPVPPGELSGAGIALLQMMVADDRNTRVAGARVAGLVFAAPIDGQPAPPRPRGLTEGAVLMLNAAHEDEQLAALEACGLLRETAAVPMITELYRRGRTTNNRRLAGGALEALARIGDPQSAEVARELVGDGFATRNDAASLAAAFARERFLKDGSAARLREAADDTSLSARARAYLAELGTPLP